MQTLKERAAWRQKLAGRTWIWGPRTATITLLCTEWIHRGSLGAGFWKDNFLAHLNSYLLTWLFFLFLYLLAAGLTRLPCVGELVTGLAGGVPATVTYNKLKMRGEPFFPRDFSQWGEATQVVGKAGLELQPSMWVSALIFAALFAAACLTRLKKWPLRQKLLGLAVPLAGAAGVLAVFLSPTLSAAAGILPDMWMQNRYYRNYGVVAGFVTNVQNLKVDKPEGYGKEAVTELARQARQQNLAPAFSGSYKAAGQSGVKQPNIIFIMDESFWDVGELENYGVEFDQPVTPNLARLRQTAAYGKAYTPSFGGGTCDVEFEALTGFSTEFLPTGSKPFQQHVTKPMFSIASYLKEQGYATQAIHGYYAKFWSRNTAYPYLGIDEFIALEDFVNPEKKRGVDWSGGLVTDAEMGRRVIEEWENRDPEKPLFMHVVTMQNHTTYNEKNYPEEELVGIQSAPAGISGHTLGALRDFATGVREADAMLGALTVYFCGVEEPTILVFWGDHYNPIDSNYDVYTTTGYASGSSTDPRLHQTPLLMWSNYSQQQVDFGTIAAYDISPVMMELFGLEQPLYFQFLNRQLRVASRSCTRGTTMNLDGTTTQQPTEFQQRWTNEHWMLQYDLMFGKGYALNRMGVAGLSGMNTGK